jgi:hypothetical protein
VTRQSGRNGGVGVTKVQIAAPAGIESQWSVTRRTFLGFELLDKLVEARFVGDMATRQLQNALSAQRVFQRLLACCAFSADQGALASRLWSSGIDHVAEFVVSRRRRGRSGILRLLLLQTRRLWTVMQTSERGKASSRRLGRCSRSRRDSGSVTMRVQGAITKDRCKINRRRRLRACHWDVAQCRNDDEQPTGLRCRYYEA